MNSSIEIDSGNPVLYNSTSPTANSFAAWMKYLPSVHNPDFFVVITAVPAEPVNPEDLS